MRHSAGQEEDNFEMIGENLLNIKRRLPSDVCLVAVSKFHPAEAIAEAYAAGQRVFGESRPQELAAKAAGASAASAFGNSILQEIKWHFIGHLQTNKLKMVLPYASLVESVDSTHLLEAIDDWGAANGKVIDVLLELHLGAEQTKQGFHEEEILELMWRYSDMAQTRKGKLSHVRICGLMGMATNTDDADAVDADFARIEDFFLYLKDLFPELEEFKELSIGMSGDWEIALRHGATIIRIGTAIFGERNI